MRPLLLPLAAALLLAGCDMLGIEMPAAAAARKDAESKAIGAACRHAGRAIEDCYTLYPRAEKGAVFAGWREMNDYMRENKIDNVAPTLPVAAAHAASAAASQAAAADEEEEDPPPKKKAKGGH